LTFRCVQVAHDRALKQRKVCMQSIRIFVATKSRGKSSRERSAMRTRSLWIKICGKGSARCDVPVHNRRDIDVASVIAPKVVIGPIYAKDSSDGSDVTYGDDVACAGKRDRLARPRPDFSRRDWTSRERLSPTHDTGGRLRQFFFNDFSGDFGGWRSLRESNPSFQIENLTS
jgi:hypothetical protein